MINVRRDGMNKIDKINKTLDLAMYIFDHPTELVLISDLIEILNIDSFGIDKKLINQLDVSKTVPSEVMDISSVIISNLNNLIR